MLIRRLIPTSLVAAAAQAAAAPAGADAAVTAKDDIADAPWIFGAGPHAIAFDTDGAGAETGELQHHPSGSMKSVWVKWTPVTSGGMQMYACWPEYYGHYFRIYKQKVAGTDSVKNLTPVFAPELKLSECNSRRQIVAATQGQAYYVAIVRSTLQIGPDPGGYFGISQAFTMPTVQFVDPPKVTGKTATIDFESATGKTYSCELDGVAKTCAQSLFSATFSESGSHTLKVTATDGYLNTSAPAIWNFTVDADPPQTFIDSTPPTTSKAFSVSFHASQDAGVKFRCRYDDVTVNPCTSPWAVPALPAGPHKITVRARDRYGNWDPTPAVKSFTVK